MRRFIPALVLTALLPVSALAGSVYLNGVRIDGVTNQKFEKVTSVRIEDPGGLPDRVVGCLTDALKKAPFPAHDRQGGEVVELPLHLTGDATDFEL